MEPPGTVFVHEAIFVGIYLEILEISAKQHQSKMSFVGISLGQASVTRSRRRRQTRER